MSEDDELRKLRDDNQRLRAALEDMLNEASGKPKSCGHDFYCCCPARNGYRALRGEGKLS